jgi:hypothetical protein
VHLFEEMRGSVDGEGLGFLVDFECEAVEGLQRIERCAGEGGVGLARL